MDDYTQIESPADLVARLKHNPDVLAILQYGSGVWRDGADTDLCVVVGHRPEGLESIHFWIGCGPVDLNVRTLGELREGGVAELPGLDIVLRDGEVLYEKQPGILSETVSQSPSSPSLAHTADHSMMRHGHAHVLAGLEYYRDRDALLCNVLLAGATHWLLGAYTAAHGLPYRGEKATLKAIREHDPDLLPELEKLASTADGLAERIETLHLLTDKILAPIGGPWLEGEVLFFSESGRSPRKADEWSAFLTSLLNVGEKARGG